MNAEGRHDGVPGTGPEAVEPDGAEVTTGAAHDEAGDEVEGDGVDDDGAAAGVETLRRQRDEYLDMVRRVQADFENYKKRMVRQQTELLERAAEGLVVRLLPVLDAFDLARAHLEDEQSPEGKALLQASGLLSDTLAKEGLERVDASGVPFDPTTHEAVDHVQGDAGDAPGEGEGEGDGDEGPVVSDVLRAGYLYKGRVVRPAMVRVKG